MVACHHHGPCRIQVTRYVEVKEGEQSLCIFNDAVIQGAVLHLLRHPSPWYPSDHRIICDKVIPTAKLLIDASCLYGVSMLVFNYPQLALKLV